MTRSPPKSNGAASPASEAKRILVEAALAVAKRYPVFPTDNKKPCWSNDELGVGKGQGGYKIATKDAPEVERLFSHRGATEIAVPMGAMSGLMCIDVDLYKYPDLTQWVTDNWSHLKNTLSHSTRSGGRHFFFQHPGDGHRFPAQIRDGVDIKAVGTGYVCWPGTKGYEVVRHGKTRAWPKKLIEAALKARGGTGRTTTGSFNELTDTELVEQIQSTSVIYPALRSLAFRLPGKTNPATGTRMSISEQEQTLHNVMDTSLAADPGHPRHDDWVDRRSKIEELVESANRIHHAPEMDADVAALLAAETPFVDPKELIAADRPIGPQRETTPEDIEARVADRKRSTTARTSGKGTGAEIAPSLFDAINVVGLARETIAPIKWVVPGVLPAGGITSLAGTSNVGKTRLMCAFAILGAAGRLPLMGWPRAKAFTTLIIANEEHVDDIKRRMKAVAQQHKLRHSRDVMVRGKTAGLMRLVALNEIGQPEIDMDAIAEIVEVARESEAKALCLDPYTTLSDAMDENSALSASALTKAFLLLVQLTGCAVFFFHHTPKDRSKDPDWYRADSAAWRGSGSIFGGLDNGYTLSNWMPRDKQARKRWREAWIRLKLGRWIVLDTGKLREGEALPPIVYELVGQEMAQGEGPPIGVLRLSSEEEAEAVLTDAAVEVLTREAIAQSLYDRLGSGKYTSMPAVHKKMVGGGRLWIGQGSWQGTRHGNMLYDLLKNTVRTEAGTVRLKRERSVRGKASYTLVIVTHPEKPNE